MTTWKIKANNKIYAEFEFNRNLKVMVLSNQAIQEDLQGKLDQKWDIFDPRNLGMRRINKPKDIYDSDLFLAAIFYEERFEIESEGVDWSKVLPKVVPGRIY